MISLMGSLQEISIFWKLAGEGCIPVYQGYPAFGTTKGKRKISTGGNGRESGRVNGKGTDWVNGRGN